MEERLRILVVEDEATTRRALVRSLRAGDADLEIREEENGLIAAGLLHSESFHCVVLDYLLPGMDGLSVLRQVREAGDKTPVIVLTAKGDEQLAVEMMKAGASDYLSKSRLSPEALVQSVRNAVRVHRAEQHAAESAERLRAHEQRLSRVLETNIDGIVIMDAEGHFDFINPAAEDILGIDAGDLTDRDDQQRGLWQRATWSAQPLADSQKPLRQVLETGEPVRGVEMVIHRRDNRRVIVSVNAAPLTDASGAVTGVVGSLRDVTEQKRLAEQLQQAQRMEAIGRLAGGIAHDFNNLLAVISGYSESMTRRLRDSDPLLGHASEIQRAAERGGSLTRQLLAFSRRQVVRPQKLNLNNVVADLQDMLRRVITDKVGIVFTPAGDLRAIEADQGQMEQVVLNLALNARDAMPAGGTLTIRTSNAELQAGTAAAATLKPGSYVRLTVSDTGYGIDANTRQHIFEPFFTTKEGKGTGLGLSIVYGIAQQAGGGVSVESEAGKGARFDVYFPAAAD